MAEQRYRFALITRFIKLSKEKEVNIAINKYAEQYTADALLESYDVSTCYEMIEYYCSITETPDWKWFARNADKIYKNLTAKKEDDRIRSLMRKKAKEWLTD